MMDPSEALGSWFDAQLAALVWVREEGLIDGIGHVSGGTAIVLTSSSPQDTNTFDEPRKVVPITAKANQVNRSFEYTFVPYSITVLEIKTK